VNAVEKTGIGRKAEQLSDRNSGHREGIARRRLDDGDLAKRGEEHMHANHLATLVEERRCVAIDADKGIDQRFVVHPRLAQGDGGEHSTVGSDAEDGMIRPDSAQIGRGLQPQPIGHRRRR
jgi:hypothetical protein